MHIEITSGAPDVRETIPEEELLKRPNILEVLDINLKNSKAEEEEADDSVDSVPPGEYYYQGNFTSLGLGEEFGDTIPFDVVIADEKYAGKTDPVTAVEIKEGDKLAVVGGYPMKLTTAKFILKTVNSPDTSKPDIEIE